MQSFRRASWRSSLKAERTYCGRRPIPLSRPFSRNCQLLLSRIPQRAQLPYLHSSIRQTGQPVQIRFFRLFTIREPKTLREAVIAFLQVGVVFYTAWGLWKVAEWGISQETLERSQPTPREYSFRTRMKLREALGEEEAGTKGSAIPNWKNTGDKFVAAIERLEDRGGDGKGLRGSLGEDEDIFVAGVGRTGMDVSTCSEPWQRGYYQALMGAGRCAERLDGWVRDRTRGVLFPEQYVIGPSYPNPKPVPPGAFLAPREEDCDPAFAAPEKYYLKVITTQGLTIGQRLRAALAYADWLRYKGLNEAAEGMHTWAIDIASEGISADPKRVVDNQTGVLQPSSATLTPNLLLASESFGTHFALTGNMSAALPVFLSILRAQQNLPEATPLPPQAEKGWNNPYIELIMRTVLPPKYPPPPASGNDAITKNPDSICSSASTMTHIGEVLFASDLAALSLDPSTLSSPPPSSPSSSATLFALPGRAPTKPTATQAAGLAWTRQAAELAEATLRAVDPDNGPERFMARQQMQQASTASQREERKRTHAQQQHCAQCLTLALDNWVQMVERFERAERHQGLTRGRGSVRPTSSSATTNSQQAQSDHVRRMMTAAYRNDAQPDEVLAEAAQAVRGSEETMTGSVMNAPSLSQAQAGHQSSPSRGGGWGWFWSSKLGLAKAPGGEAVDVEQRKEKGPWELEAIQVRTRRREARLLARQLGLED